MAVHCLVFLGCLTISPLPVSWCPFNNSTLPVRWCQAVALAFLHLSLGHQKATSGTFSMDGFGGLGLNPAGVSLFRMQDACWTVPLGAPKFRFRRCLSGDVRQLRWPFFIFLYGVRKQRQAVFRLMVLVGWARILLGFPCFGCMLNGAPRGP